MVNDKQHKTQLFAIQSCPILHGPVIVFDSRDVEILKQLGVSTIANENASASSSISNSLVRDIEEAKDIRKGEFTTTQQLPDILPKSIHTTLAARILRSRRRVPFTHKTFTTYTQVMKYLKSSPAALEIIEGRQFDLKKPTVGYTRPPPKFLNIVREPARTIESTAALPKNGCDEPQDDNDSDKAENVIDKENDKHDKTIEEADNTKETSEKSADEIAEVNMETPEVNGDNDINMETQEVSNDNDINMETREGSSGSDINMETPKVSNENDINMDAVDVKNANDGKTKQDEGTKTNSAASVQRQKAAAPQQASTSPAELVKLRKRASVKAAAIPEPAPKKRGRAPTKKRGRAPKKSVDETMAPAKAPTTQSPDPANMAPSTVGTSVVAIPAKSNKRALPLKAKTIQTTESTTPSTTTTVATQLPSTASVDAPSVGRSPIKKRGRVPKAKPVAPPAIAEATAANKPPVKKHGSPPKAKQVDENLTTPTAAPDSAPDAVVAAADLVVPQPQAKKRGRSPTAKTTTSGKSSSPPPKKRGRSPKNKTPAVDAAEPAVSPVATVQPPNPSTVAASSEDTIVATPKGTTAAANTNMTERTGTTKVATEPVVMTPPRRPRDNTGDAPFTPGTNYNSDESSMGEDPLIPIIESPVKRPAGPGHFSTRNAGAKWNEKFLELFRYKMQHGNCNVSTKTNDNPHKALGEWVRIQRRRKNGKSTSLKPLSLEEEAKLNAIGFDWRSTGKQEWEDRYRQLVKYKMAYGNVDVPDDFTENPSLAAWCAAQRKHWRQKLLVEKQQSMDGEDGDELQESMVDENGKKNKLSSPMTDEQEGKLLALGFQF